MITLTVACRKLFQDSRLLARRKTCRTSGTSSSRNRISSPMFQNSSIIQCSTWNVVRLGNLMMSSNRHLPCHKLPHGCVYLNLHQLVWSSQTFWSWGLPHRLKSRLYRQTLKFWENISTKDGNSVKGKLEKNSILMNQNQRFLEYLVVLTLKPKMSKPLSGKIPSNFSKILWLPIRKLSSAISDQRKPLRWNNIRIFPSMAKNLLRISSRR